MQTGRLFLRCNLLDFTLYLAGEWTHVLSLFLPQICSATKRKKKKMWIGDTNSLWEPSYRDKRAFQGALKLCFSQCFCKDLIIFVWLLLGHSLVKEGRQTLAQERSLLNQENPAQHNKSQSAAPLHRSIAKGHISCFSRQEAYTHSGASSQLQIISQHLTFPAI